MVGSDVTNTTPGGIKAGEFYSLSSVKQILSMSGSALRAADRQGNFILRVGKRGFVKGEELIKVFQEIHDSRQASS